MKYLLLVFIIGITSLQAFSQTDCSILAKETYDKISGNHTWVGNTLVFKDKNNKDHSVNVNIERAGQSMLFMFKKLGTTITVKKDIPIQILFTDTSRLTIQYATSTAAKWNWFITTSSIMRPEILGAFSEKTIESIRFAYGEDYFDVDVDKAVATEFKNIVNCLKSK